jgi:hypothetical protein
MTSTAIVAAPLLLLTYYVVVYCTLETDSKPQVMVPQYEPPGGFSPAVLRFVWRGVADARSVAAVFASLSSRRLIALQKISSAYEIKRLYSQTTPLPGLPREENVVLDFLFSSFFEKTTFDPARQSQGCASVILGVLTRDVGTRYRQSHAGYIAIGVLVSCIAGFWLLSIKHELSVILDCLIASAFIAGLAVFGAIVAQAIQPLIRDIRQGTWKFMRIFLALVLVLFFAMWFVVAGAKLHLDYSWNVINAIFAMALLNVVAQPFLRRDTEEGKKLKQQIEGFRTFLVAVEQDQLDRMNTPHKDIEFTGHLAYAVALEVKEAWGDYLSNAFSQI